MEREFSLGPWRVEPRLNRISRDNAVVSHLEPRVMQTLCCLAAAPDGVVSRDELLARVWQDAHVTEDALNRAISRLRKVLGDQARDPRYIETIPKVGYRLLVTPVTEADSPEPAQSTAQLTARAMATATANASQAPRNRPSWAAAGIGLLLLASTVGLAAVRMLSPAKPSPTLPPTARATPLTTAVGPELFPALSPDGGRVAYVRLSAGGGPELRVEVVGGNSGLRFGVDSEGAYAGAAHISPSWSPDGREIAWIRLHETCEVVISEALGGTVRPLADCPDGRVGEIAWSPDGRWIVAAPEPGTSRVDGLRLLPVAGGAALQLTTGADFRMSFSPDGRAVAFVRHLAFATDELYVLDLGPWLDSDFGPAALATDPTAGLERLAPARQLTRDRRRIHGTAWSDDGQWILFTSDRGGEFALWRVALDGSSVQALGLSAPRLGRLSTGGGQLAIERWDVDAAIRRVRLNAGARLAEPSVGNSQLEVIGQLEDIGVGSTHLEWNATYSPDGRSFVFVSTRTGSAELWLTETEPSQRRGLRQLTRLGTFVQAPAWSPDGLIAFETVTDDGADIFVVDTAGRPSRPLVASHWQERSPTWSRDGRWLYFASDRSGDWQIWRRQMTGQSADVSDSRDQQMTTTGGFFGIESADGRWLFHSRRTEPGIWRQALDPDVGSTLGHIDSRRVTTDLRPSDWLSWHLQGSNVLLARRPQGLEGLGLEVVRLDPQTGTEKVLIQIQEHNFETGLSVSPDGAWALLTLLDRVEVDLLLVDGVL